MESRTLCHRATRAFHPVAAFRTLVASAALIAAAGCGGGSASASSQAPTPQPVGEVERTQFSPDLGVHLDKMLKKPSGLYVEDLATGTGQVAARERTVVVRYVGWLPSGKTIDQGEITVALGSNKVIRAWEEGLLGMRVGGRRLLVTPPSLAYGGAGAGNEIPPNAVLVFVMQLQAVY
jgi:FKBP-type peptidyl-prolyl cis-trans isomerase FkpA